MRLFISFDMPTGIQSDIKRLQSNFIGMKGIKLANQLHITLKFLGEVKEKEIEAIKKRLGDVKFTPFEVSLGGLGVFPNEKQVRVIWIGLNPEGEIIDLHNYIDSALDGLFENDVKFSPHLTIARVEFIEDKKKFSNKIKLKVDGKFMVNEFKLMESEFVNGVHKHKCLETYKLG